jgi:hypothetical protein
VNSVVYIGFDYHVHELYLVVVLLLWRIHVRYDQFLKYLRDTGISTTFPVTLSVVADSTLLSRFCEWMRLQRGTCDATLSRHRRYVRGLLTQLGDVPRKGLAMISAFGFLSAGAAVLPNARACFGSQDSSVHRANVRSWHQWSISFRWSFEQCSPPGSLRLKDEIHSVRVRTEFLRET